MTESTEDHIPPRHPYLAKPILEWLLERADNSLAGMKFREAADEIARLRAQVQQNLDFTRGVAELLGYTVTPSDSIAGEP